MLTKCWNSHPSSQCENISYLSFTRISKSCKYNDQRKNMLQRLKNEYYTLEPTTNMLVFALLQSSGLHESTTPPKSTPRLHGQNWASHFFDSTPRLHRSTPRLHKSTPRLISKLRTSRVVYFALVINCNSLTHQWSLYIRTHETWSRLAESWSRIMSHGVDLWSRIKSHGVDLWSRGVESWVMESTCGVVESNYESRNRRVVESTCGFVESTQESWSRLMSRGIEKFWSRPVESAHESWSRIMNRGIDLWLKLHGIYSYYIFLKNGHFQNRLHDSTVKNEPASDSTVLCNRE